MMKRFPTLLSTCTSLAAFIFAGGGTCAAVAPEDAPIARPHRPQSDSRTHAEDLHLKLAPPVAERAF